jgi:teichuronic acid exporter
MAEVICHIILRYYNKQKLNTFVGKRNQMGSNLKNSAISGAKWNGAYTLGKYMMTFVLSMVLARLLLPEEFGLMGMISILNSIALVFVLSGLSTALIRTKNCTEEDYSTVFIFNIVVSLLFYLLFFFSAPLIANFFNEPELVLLIRIISLVFIINSFGIIQNTRLIIELNFKKQALFHLVGVAFSVFVAIVMAYSGFGVYSIAGQSISQALVTTTLFWVASGWRPKLVFSVSSFKKLWAFGSNILMTNIVEKIIDNVDNILIGKVFNAATLGFFVRAKSSKTMPEDIFRGIMNTTSFPILSKLSDSPKEFNHYHIQFYKIAVYFYMPVAICFIAIAESFIVLLFSDRWLPSVPMLQIIAITSLPIFLGALFNQSILAHGASKLYLKINVIKKTTTLLTIPFGLFFGLYPFLLAHVGVGFFCLFVDMFYTGRLLGIPTKKYIPPLFIPFVFSMISAGLMYSLTFLHVKSWFVLFFSQLAVGVITYVGLSELFRICEYKVLKKAFFEQINSVTKKFVK